MPLELRRAREVLAPAIASWDVLDFEPPPTHRSGWRALAAVSGKRMLRAMHRRALEPQRDLNRALLALVTQALEGPDEKLRGEVAAHLARLSAPVAGRGYFRTFEEMVAPVLEKQRTWNLLALQLLEESLRAPPPSLHRVHFHLGTLFRSAAIPVLDDLTGVARATFDQWVHFFGKQAVFNRSVTAALGVLNGVPRPPDSGAAYPGALLSWEKHRQEEATQALRRLTSRPLISIVTPTWETPATLLRACIDSVRAQSYDHWELCLADDGSKGASVREVIAEYNDPRIRHQLLPENGGIARATNAALAMARGDYVGFLDHDDTLAPNALAEIALALARWPQTDVFFSDEDRLDFEGRRTLPFFKPGWSPDMLTSGNYVCHFLVARRLLIEQVGRIREGYDGAQDFDLVLRLWECTPRIRHICEVLYHWRDTPQSTAVTVVNKPGAGSAGARVLADHLARCQVEGHVLSPAPTQYQVSYSAVGTPLVAVVTAPKRASNGWVERFGFCRDVRTQLVVVGGGQVSGASFVRWDGAHDLAAMYRAAIASYPADVYVFIDEEVEPADGYGLKELVAQASRPEIGVVGAKLLYADSTIRHAGLWATAEGRFVRPFQHMADEGEWTTIGNAHSFRNFVAVSGACFAARADVIAKAGGFQTGKDPATWLCAKARAMELRVVCSPLAVFIHPGLDVDEPLNHALDPDPYLNPNVDPSSTNGRIRSR